MSDIGNQIETETYTVIRPTQREVPILLSSPHSGVEFPSELQDNFDAIKIKRPDDVDWFIHELYNFVGDFGITLVHARYCRWVIDLNRSPESKNLYDDGRIITSLCPTTNFFGETIYRGKEFEPDQEEVTRRLKLYYEPYHTFLRQKLMDLKTKFGFALLFDAHSIRKKVDTIHKEPFSNFILGTNDGKSASAEIIESVVRSFDGHDFAHNHPFKGGQITRSFGDPKQGIHAIQLEQAKTNYMDDDEIHFNVVRARQTREILIQMFQNILKTVF